MSTDTITRTEAETVEIHEVDFLTSNEPEQASHIVLISEEDKAEGKTAQSLVLEARIYGTPLTALCGHTWVPSKDPKNYPLCSKCKEVYEYDPEGHGDRDQLPDA